jgi:hypothetical protein
VNNTENIKIEILSKAKIYFNSLEPHFIYWRKHKYQILIVNIMRVLALLLFFFNLVPVIPYLSGKITSIISKTLKIRGTYIPLDNFFSRWILFAVLSGVIFVLIYFIHKVFINKFYKKNLDSVELCFVYLNKLIQELEMFIVNENDKHIAKAISYYYKFFNQSFLFYRVSISDGFDRTIFLPQALLQLNEDFPFIKFSKTTEQILVAFKDFDSKVVERIKQKIQIDIVIDILNDFVVFHYLIVSRFKTEQLQSQFSDKLSASTFFLESCAQKTNEISIIDKIKNRNQKTSINNIISKAVYSLFNRQNLIVTFLIWCGVLSITFFLLIYLGKYIYDFKIDATVYITAISGIVAGALAVSIAVYTKNGTNINNNIISAEVSIKQDQ